MNTTAPAQAATPASSQGEARPADIPVEAQQKLSDLGLQGDALSQFLADLEDEPDDDLSAALGLKPAQPVEANPRAAEEESKAEGPPPTPTPAQPLTEEEITATYGELVAGKAKEAGIDLNAWRAAFEAGADTATFRQSMANALGLPVEVVAQYEAGSRRPEAPGQPQPLGEAEEKALIEFAGGRPAFDQLSSWVAATIPDNPAVTGFNAAVVGGNGEAAKAYLLAIHLLHQQDAGHEPQLIHAGDTYGEASDVYQNYDQLIADKTAVDQRTGRPRYEVDPKWRKYVENKTRRSNALM
ncbi:MAG: hypothetical protein FJ083_11155 [Cyanobacteria bacterium K_Offshore_surface_m2_239]|nr:hypothetical protein [Cyanobacteria bacterium K_Offshore_surface_m2_239]